LFCCDAFKASQRATTMNVLGELHAVAPPKLTDLGADSIDLYEVVMSLEENFNIHITDRDAQSFVTVGDAIAFIKGKVG
jgi:acyl carrier protein